MNYKEPRDLEETGENPPAVRPRFEKGNVCRMEQRGDGQCQQDFGKDGPKIR